MNFLPYCLNQFFETILINLICLFKFKDRIIAYNDGSLSVLMEIY